jgi:hypothetical protein
MPVQPAGKSPSLVIRNTSNPQTPHSCCRACTVHMSVIGGAAASAGTQPQWESLPLIMASRAAVSRQLALAGAAAGVSAGAAEGVVAGAAAGAAAEVAAGGAAGVTGGAADGSRPGTSISVSNPSRLRHMGVWVAKRSRWGQSMCVQALCKVRTQQNRGDLRCGYRPPAHLMSSSARKAASSTLARCRWPCLTSPRHMRPTIRVFLTAAARVSRAASPTAAAPKAAAHAALSAVQQLATVPTAHYMHCYCQP